MPLPLGLENCIRGMRHVVRGCMEARAGHPGTPRWWVLAVGGRLDPDNFDQREMERGRLTEAVDRAGIPMREFIWVWDETDTAQLVLAECASKEQAQQKATELSNAELVVRVREEMRD